MREEFKPYDDHYRYDVRAYTIPDGIGYHGCGYGWIEVDENGYVIKMRYADNLQDEGSLEENVTFPDCGNQPGDRILANGVLRIYASFSCWEACIPIPH